MVAVIAKRVEEDTGLLWGGSFNSCDEAPFTSILSGPLSSKTIDNYHTIWIGGMVLFCTFMKPSMDKSRESCNNHLW